MFNKIRNAGKLGDKAKAGREREPLSGAHDGDVDRSGPPPRLELPRRPARPEIGSPFTGRPPHLKAVPPGGAATSRPATPARAQAESRPVSRPVAQPIAQPVSKPVSQPISKPVSQPISQPGTPARPAIPPYPTPGARGGAKPAGGAEVQSLGRLMLVGPSIRLNGEIKACERLIVEGEVEGELSETERLEVARGGRFHGSARVESCMVDGLFEGELEVRGVLTLRANGRIQGVVSYGEIEIERGGVIAGSFGERGEGQAARPAKSGGPRPT